MDLPTDSVGDLGVFKHSSVLVGSIFFSICGWLNEIVEISEPKSEVSRKGFSSSLGFLISKSDTLLSDICRFRLFFMEPKSLLETLSTDFNCPSVEGFLDFLAVVDKVVELEVVADVPDFRYSCGTTISSEQGKDEVISWLEPIPESCERHFNADFR